VIETMELAEILVEDLSFYKLALSAINSPDNDEILINAKKLFEIPSDYLVIYRNAFLLGWIQSNESYEILKTNLRNPNPAVREACAFVLGQIAEKEMSEDLLRMLQDDDIGVRRMTATVIGWAGGNFHIAIMKELRLMQNLKIREEVKSILTQIGSKQALQALSTIV
jgi:HEAT repeat protein